MRHDLLWSDDLDRIASLGVQAIRYGIPWHRVNPAPGRFDWSWTDPVLHHLVEVRGLTPIIDLVHFGTPLWLENEFLAPDYPDRVAEYARAFAERYGHLVHHYTPLNEPGVTAIRSGRDGAWPPYRRGRPGYVAVLLAVNRGMIATAEAIRQVQPEAVMVHAEDVGIESATTPDVARFASIRQLDRWLPLDIACGRFRPDHPLWTSFTQAPWHADIFLELADRAIRWDVLGINYYPWSNRRWKRRPDGLLVIGRDKPGNAALALRILLRLAHDRYQIPVMVTETSAPGSISRRLAWMDQAVHAALDARLEGVPVVGFTWFPAFTMVDWRYRRSKRPMSDHLLHLGLWDIPFRGGDLERVATPLVTAYQKIVAGPVIDIGSGVRQES